MKDLYLLLEMLYFACAPLLVILACIGLWQLKITKEASRLSAQRHSLTVAAQQCDHYQNHVVPLVDAVNAAVKQNEIMFYDGFEAELTENSVLLHKKMSNEKLKKEVGKLSSIASERVRMFNAIEAFAVFFTSGVADERVAFSSVGNTYCYTIKKFLPDIIVIIEGKYYKNVVKLFLMWNLRFESEKLQISKKKVEEQLSKLTDRHIYPIGTE